MYLSSSLDLVGSYRRESVFCTSEVVAKLLQLLAFDLFMERVPYTIRAFHLGNLFTMWIKDLKDRFIGGVDLFRSDRSTSVPSWSWNWSSLLASPCTHYIQGLLCSSRHHQETGEFLLMWDGEPHDTGELVSVCVSRPMYSAELFVHD